LVLTAGAQASGWDDRREDAVHRELDRAVTPQPGNEHLLRLSALRALHDERLVPLLVSLTEDDDPAIQVHALLGLAELAPDGHLEPATLLQADPIALESALAVGLETDRLGTEDMQRLLEDSSIRADSRLWLLGALLEAGAEVAPATVTAVDTSDNPLAAARQSAQLAHLGHAESLRADTERLLQGTPSNEQLDAALEAMDQTRRLPSEAGFDLARACLRSSSPDGVRRYALLTLLEQRASGAVDLFCEEVAATTRRRHLVDLSLLLLMTNTATPEACRARLENDELLAALSRAAIALAADPTTALPSLQGLIESGHRRTIAWVLAQSEQWEDRIAVPLLERILDRSVQAGLRAPTASHGVRSASLLLERAPDAFRTRLIQAEDDGIEQQVLLLALLQRPAPSLAEAVASIRRIGVGPADVLALLVHARDQEVIAAADVANLKLVAASSTASEAVRTQAAWLAVRHSGIVDDVVASLVKLAR
jgi:hypothetical protein